ncbi:MAG: hypothetical protein ACRC33_24025, partial [Gemmataceae bacterium]
MYPHRIRLRGPWEWSRGDDSGTLVLPGALAGVTGPVTFRRRFGYPGTIDAHERVWLLTAGGAASVNGVPLGEGLASDVTPLLRPRNELTVVTDAGTPGEVALEVRATAYLADVRAEGDAVVGRVVGAADGPLDLYLIVGRYTAAQASVRATPEGTAFALDLTPPAPLSEAERGGHGGASVDDHS